jgi:hypothetical protein
MAYTVCSVSGTEGVITNATWKKAVCYLQFHVDIDNWGEAQTQHVDLFIGEIPEINQMHFVSTFPNSSHFTTLKSMCCNKCIICFWLRLWKLEMHLDSTRNTQCIQTQPVQMLGKPMGKIVRIWPWLSSISRHFLEVLKVAATYKSRLITWQSSEPDLAKWRHHGLPGLISLAF